MSEAVYTGGMYKGVLKNFVKFTRKHLCRKITGWRSTALLKETSTQLFPVNFAKFLKTLFL